MALCHSVSLRGWDPDPSHWLKLQQYPSPMSAFDLHFISPVSRCTPTESIGANSSLAVMRAVSPALPATLCGDALRPESRMSPLVAAVRLGTDTAALRCGWLLSARLTAYLSRYTDTRCLQWMKKVVSRADGSSPASDRWNPLLSPPPSYARSQEDGFNLSPHFNDPEGDSPRNG